MRPLLVQVEREPRCELEGVLLVSDLGLFRKLSIVDTENASFLYTGILTELVPEAELHDLIIELRSQTLGLGTYRKEFDHLAETRGVEMRRGAA